MKVLPHFASANPAGRFFTVPISWNAVDLLLIFFKMLVLMMDKKVGAEQKHDLLLLRYNPHGMASWT